MLEANFGGNPESPWCYSDNYPRVIYAYFLIVQFSSFSSLTDCYLKYSGNIEQVDPKKNSPFQIQ